VVTHVTRNGGSGDDAEDVLQESVVIAWERVRTGAFQPNARLSTFVYAVARHIWLRRLARSRREVHAVVDEIPSGDLSFLDEMEADEGRATFESAFRRLEATCRTLLLLYYWERLSMEEIGKAMGFANADTVKAKKYQCKKRLSELAGAAGTP
jgi:RNA polymerase sigma factor (sigma-70 family)